MGEVTRQNFIALKSCLQKKWKYKWMKFLAQKKMDKEKQVEWNKKELRMKIKTKFNEVRDWEIANI